MKRSTSQSSTVNRSKKPKFIGDRLTDDESEASMAEDDDSDDRQMDQDRPNTSSGQPALLTRPSNTSTETVYNITTSNRFAQLPIPIPENNTLRIVRPAKPIIPPAFFVFETVSKVKNRIPTNQNYVMQNLRNCVK